MPQTGIPASNTVPYTTLIEWRTPTGGTFDGAFFAENTAYRLQVVLNANEGFTFAGQTDETMKGFTLNGIEPFERIFNSNKKIILQFEFPATGAALEMLTVSLTAGNGKLTLAPQTPAAGYAFYYSYLNESVSHPGGTNIGILELATTAYTQAVDIPGQNGTKIYVQVFKVVSADGTIVGFGEATTVNITANAAPNGQQFKEWTVNSGSVTLANAQAQNTTFTMPANAVTVTATYEALPESTYSITVQNDSNGTANANVNAAQAGAANSSGRPRWCPPRRS